MATLKLFWSQSGEKVYIWIKKEAGEIDDLDYSAISEFIYFVHEWNGFPEEMCKARFEAGQELAARLGHKLEVNWEKIPYTPLISEASDKWKAKFILCRCLLIYKERE